MSTPTRRRRLLTGLLAASLAAVLAGVLVEGRAQGASMRTVGRVSYLEGRAWRAQGRGKLHLLHKGTAVYEKDHVKTGTGTRLEIRLTDGSAVRLGPKSEMVLSSATFRAKKERKKVSIRLILGRIWSKVTHALHGDDTYEVHTATAVAGVRGTSFRVNAASDKSTLVSVYSGTVAVAGVRPIYARHTPGAKRKEVPGPSEVSKKKWEKLVGAMMTIKIGSNGLPGDPEHFQLADQLKQDKDGWIAWNTGRDKAWDAAHHKH